MRHSQISRGSFEASVLDTIEVAPPEQTAEPDMMAWDKAALMRTMQPLVS